MQGSLVKETQHSMVTPCLNQGKPLFLLKQCWVLGYMIMVDSRQQTESACYLLMATLLLCGKAVCAWHCSPTLVMSLLWLPSNYCLLDPHSSTIWPTAPPCGDSTQFSIFLFPYPIDYSAFRKNSDPLTFSHFVYYSKIDKIVFFPSSFTQYPIMTNAKTGL